MARLLPFTVRTAPELLSGTTPSDVLPSANDTLPAGTPLVAFTVALICVVPPGAMIAGLAAAEMLVATTGAVTVTDTDPLEFVKLPVAL